MRRRRRSGRPRSPAARRSSAWRGSASATSRARINSLGRFKTAASPLFPSRSYLPGDRRGAQFLHRPHRHPDADAAGHLRDVPLESEDRDRRPDPDRRERRGAGAGQSRVRAPSTTCRRSPPMDSIAPMSSSTRATPAATIGTRTSPALGRSFATDHQQRATLRMIEINHEPTQSPAAAPTCTRPRAASPRITNFAAEAIDDDRPRAAAARSMFDQRGVQRFTDFSPRPAR